MTKRTVKAQKMLGTALRIDESTLTRADALIDYVSLMHARVTTRADVMRVALVRGLAVLEKEAART